MHSHRYSNWFESRFDDAFRIKRNRDVEQEKNLKLLNNGRRVSFGK